MQPLEITEPLENVVLQDNNKVIAIGIDLGTTNSLAGFSLNQKPIIIQDDSSDDILPSIVTLMNDGQLSVGSYREGEVSIKSVKRLMGKSFTEIQENTSLPSYIKDIIFQEDDVVKVRLGQKTFTPEELSAQILLNLKQRAEKFFGYSIEKAVITVPAYFDDTARNATIFAAKLAGLEVLRLISEPTAAAYAYGLDQRSEGYFVVYDLGGGTFDVSLLNMQMGVFQVIATNGNSMLGGDDIDHVIYDHCLNILRKDFDITTLNTESARILLEEAKRAKESFSAVSQTTLKLDLAGKTIEIILDKSTFEDLIAPIIQDTINLLKQTIEESEIYPEDIEGIILVGGSTRLESIKKELQRNFNIKIFNNVDPDRVVALGAALQAENLTKGSNNLLIDVTPLSLGLELMGGIVDKLIMRNTPIPCSVTKQFTTYTDNQTGMKFHIVQGDREIASECRSLVQFELTGIPPMKAGAAIIDVNFKLDADGVLFISATEQTTSVSQQVTLKPSYGLNFEQMQQMLLQAFKNAEKDHQYKLLQETIVEAKRVIEVLTAALTESNNILDKSEYNLIKEHIDKTLEQIEQGNRQAIQDSLEILEKQAGNFIAMKMSNDMTKALKGTKI
ncbi:MAG: hscA [Rickettsiaceae bacterium]|jgi:molecular chaperone HscA|nr:hscA [Rickettsiaceae bacterium]